MPKYEIRYGEMASLGVFPLLGEVDYPYELRKGDTVIISGNMLRLIREEFPNVSKRQYVVASINYFLPDENGNFSYPIVYINAEGLK